MESLGLVTEDFANPTRGINLESFTNIGVSEAQFRAKYGNGKYAILTKGEMAQMILASQQHAASLIEKGETVAEPVLLKIDKVLVDLEKGGQSLVFCIEKPKEQEITKAEDNNIEKAVLTTYDSKIAFKKTGKAIKEKLVLVKAAILAKVAEVSIQMAALQVAVGFDPTEKANEWWYRNNYQNKVGDYLVYPDDACYYSTGDNYNGFNGSVNGNLSQETCNQCRQYNRAVSNLIDLKCDSAECDTFIDNLDDNEEYTLTADQLTKLGF